MAQRQDIDVQHFEQRLQERRQLMLADIRRELEKHEGQQFTDLIPDGGDAQDHSVADLLVHLNLAEINRDLDELRAIEYALGRINAGSYGVCQSCGGSIAKERLEAIPETPLCIDCQENAERQRDTRTPSL